MQSSSRPVVVLVLASALALAGCLGGEEAPAQRTFSASGGKVSEGWAYDGVGVAPASATLEGTLDQAQDAGSVTVAFQLGGAQYAAVFDAFAESKPFQQGGIVFNLDEHGDTGVADASIPRIHALAAAWGTAKVTKDGVPLVGSAGDAWTAHLMVSRDTVRGADGKILDAAATAPYDPAKPGDARRIENDPQALLILKHPDGETFRRAPVSGSDARAITGPEQTLTVEVPTEAGLASATVNVTVTGGNAPVALGQFALRILDANGTVLVEEAPATLAPNAPLVKSYALDPAQVKGPLTVEISGSGAYTATIDWTLAYDDRPFLVLTWDEVTLS